MRQTPLYSASRRAPPVTPEAPDAAAAAIALPAPVVPRRRRWLALGLALATLVAAAALWRAAPPLARPLTQKDIDRAVLHTLANNKLPAPAAKAFDAIRGSVVKVIGYPDVADPAARGERPARPGSGKPSAPGKEGGKDGGKDNKGAEEREEREERGIGSGVVILENGTILTNLHVVFGAKRIKVVFDDGLEAEADLISLQPQNDLAVLRARKIPDDLKPATLRSTGDLKPGDRVTAVGFPFGIGPSVSHGVVSGLKREFRSPEGQKILTNLIQFDAAANPGNSGGPLVTDDGEVVGIVTAIYNPTRERFFVGIGFAVPIENAAQAVGMPPF